MRVILTIWPSEEKTKLSPSWEMRGGGGGGGAIREREREIEAKFPSLSRIMGEYLQLPVFSAINLGRREGRGGRNEERS